MKKLFCLLIILSSIILTSCSSDDNISTFELYIKFKFNGEKYEMGTVATDATGRSGSVFSALGPENAPNLSIALLMPFTPSIGAHAFVLDNDDYTNYSAHVIKQGHSYKATSGSLKITKLDTDFVVGTFSFTGSDENGETCSVTDGIFKAYRARS